MDRAVQGDERYQIAGGVARTTASEEKKETHGRQPGADDAKDIADAAVVALNVARATRKLGDGGRGERLAKHVPSEVLAPPRLGGILQARLQAVVVPQIVFRELPAGDLQIPVLPESSIRFQIDPQLTSN